MSDGYKPIWRVLITPIGGTAQDVSYYVSDGGQGGSVIDVQDQTTDRSSTFQVNLWDHDDSGLLTKFGIGDTVEIWSDTQESSSNAQETATVDMAGVSLAVKSWMSLSDTSLQTSTSMDGKTWTPFVAVGSDGSIKSPPYRWIRVNSGSATVTYKAMPKRLTGIVNNLYTSQDGPNVKTLELVGNDYTSRTMNSLVTAAYTTQTADAIIIDVLKNYFPDITYNNVQTGAPSVIPIKWSHKSGFDCFNQLAQITGWDWYVDAEKDFHWFPASQNPASVSYSTTNDGGYTANIYRGSAKFQTDGTKLENKITFYGGTYLSDPRTEQRAGDGQTQTFFTTYPIAQSPQVYVNGTQVSAGQDQIDTNRDWYYATGKNYLKQADGATALISSDVLKVVYQYNVPLIEQLQNDSSIAKYGLFEGAKVDSSVKDRTQARAIINGLLQQYAFPIIYGTFDSWEPTITSGEFVTVNAPDQGVSGTGMKVTQAHHQISATEYVVSLTTYGRGS